jgi:hypothetical protein
VELEQNLEVIASMSSAPHAIFQLLVAVSGILQNQDYSRLGPVLWKYFLDSAEAVTLGPVRKRFMYVNPLTTAQVVYLLMQCAEKSASAPVVEAITQDLIG